MQIGGLPTCYWIDFLIIIIIIIIIWDSETRDENILNIIWRERRIKNYLHCILTVWQHDSIIIICFNADTTHQTWYADQEDRNKFQRGFLYDLKARLGKIR